MTTTIFGKDGLGDTTIVDERGRILVRILRYVDEDKDGAFDARCAAIKEAIDGTRPCARCRGRTFIYIPGVGDDDCPHCKSTGFEPNPEAHL
jgi:hypothetical protein